MSTIGVTILGLSVIALGVGGFIFLIDRLAEWLTDHVIKQEKRMDNYHIEETENGFIIASSTSRQKWVAETVTGLCDVLTGLYNTKKKCKLCGKDQ